MTLLFDERQRLQSIRRRKNLLTPALFQPEGTNFLQNWFIVGYQNRRFV
jgi:hypothetical protein